jgi:DNA-3-methyladenine glycosylase II
MRVAKVKNERREDAVPAPSMATSTSRYIHSEADLAAALKHLTRADPRLGSVLAVAQAVPLRRRAAGFAGLVAIVCAQQLSVASASAIFGRLEKAFDPFHHDALRRARAERLQRLGLSGAKIRTLRAIAKTIAAGDLDLDAITAHDADTAHAMLTAVHGIGPWTADSYLLFCVGHADAWPAGDLALQEAIRHAFALERRPTTTEMGPLAEPWRPYRGVAARLLWSYYRAIKGREGAPAASEAVRRKRVQTQSKRRR